MATLHKPSDVVTIHNVSKSLTEWASELGTPVQTILGRLKRGQSIEQACTTAVSQAGGQNRGKSVDADVLAADEVQQLLGAGRKSETAVRDVAILVIAYRSGLRCTEILSLAPKDLDMTRGTITVRHGKGDKMRVVALDPSGWPYVLAWIELRSTWQPADNSPLFCTRQCKRLSDRQVRAMISRRAARAGLSKHVHAHGLRRTMASEMAAEGVPLMDIAGALGHSNVSTTNTYLKRINPASVIDAMKQRSWGGCKQVVNIVTSAIPAPGWLDRMRAEIGDRLQLIHDARTSEEEFKAVILLF